MHLHGRMSIQFAYCLPGLALACAVGLVGMDYRHAVYAAMALMLTSIVGGYEIAVPRARSRRRSSTTTPRLTRALVVGAGSVGQALAENLEGTRRYEIAGFVDDDWPFPTVANRWPVLGRRADTAQIVENLGIDEVVIAYAPTWQQSLADNLTSSSPHLRVTIVPSPFEACMATPRVGHRGDIAIVPLYGAHNAIQLGIKRTLDILFALTGLVILFPVYLLAVIAIKLTSRGPATFSQTRVGLHGKTFRMHKLRTMVVNAESSTGPIRSPGKADARLTRVGRFLRLCRLDEIPQLWNVLAGDMSMVGPRPERPEFTEIYARTSPHYVRRHNVLPGITGLAQVCGGYHTDARDKLRFDLIYASHWSLWMDFTIILRTIAVVFFPAVESFEAKKPHVERSGT